MVALRGSVCEGVGLVRMVQVTKETCLIEATIDGLAAMPHQISVHAYGDMSEGGHRYRYICSHHTPHIPTVVGRWSLVES